MKDLSRKIKQGNSNTDKIIANACGTKLKIRIMMIELSPKTPEDELEYSTLMYTIQHPEEFQVVRDEMVISQDSERVGKQTHLFEKTEKRLQSKARAGNKTDRTDNGSDDYVLTVQDFNEKFIIKIYGSSNSLSQSSRQM